MAYWMTHLRVTEALLRCLPEGISLPHYYAGSIAPDCGRTEWNEDGTPRYLPGRVVTHWLKKDEALDRCLIDFEGFYNAMMPQAADDGARAFYWGYYIHLITDAMWQERVLRPRRESLADPSKENIAAMRADLKLADLADYRENPHYPPLEILRNTPSPTATSTTTPRTTLKTRCMASPSAWQRKPPLLRKVFGFPRRSAMSLLCLPPPSACRWCVPTWLNLSTHR
jgi:hypothetical protein